MFSTGTPRTRPSSIQQHANLRQTPTGEICDGKPRIDVDVDTPHSRAITKLGARVNRLPVPISSYKTAGFKRDIPGHSKINTRGRPPRFEALGVDCVGRYGKSQVAWMMGMPPYSLGDTHGTRYDGVLICLDPVANRVFLYPACSDGDCRGDHCVSNKDRRQDHKKA